MKKGNRTLTLSLLLTFFFAIPTMAIGSPTDIVTEITAIDDTYVRGGTYSLDNYEGDMRLYSKGNVIDKYTRNLYLKAYYPGDIDYDEVYLVLVPRWLEGDISILLWEVNPFWAENQLNWENAPLEEIGGLPIVYNEPKEGYKLAQGGLVDQSQSVKTVINITKLFSPNTCGYGVLSLKISSMSSDLNSYWSNEISYSGLRPKLLFIKHNETPPAAFEGCEELYPGHNDVNANRVNLIYTGVNWAGTVGEIPGTLQNLTPSQEAEMVAAMRNAVDLEGNLDPLNYGTKALMELEVYKDHKDDFNFWYVPMTEYVGDVTSGSCYQVCANSIPLGSCEDLSNSRVQSICNFECRGTSYLGGDSWTTINRMPGTANHEMQHSFAYLRDEYWTIGGTDDRPGYPNCAPDLATAEAWWGPLVGMEKEGRTVGYYEGCSYVESNIRPYDQTIMRASADSFLGLINENQIAELISIYTEPAQEGPAYEVVFDINGGVSVNSVEKINTYSAVDAAGPPGPVTHTVTLDAPEGTYSKNFTVYDYLLVEDEGMQEIKKDQVRVIIPVDEMPLPEKGGISAQSVSAPIVRVEEI